MYTELEIAVCGGLRIHQEIRHACCNYTLHRCRLTDHLGCCAAGRLPILWFTDRPIPGLSQTDPESQFHDAISSITLYNLHASLQKFNGKILIIISLPEIEQKDDLSEAWQSVGKAKADLRRIEHRLGEFDHAHLPPPPRLNETVETSITDYFADHNETYDIDVLPAGLLDRYGRTSHSRTRHRLPPRKISRLDDKYAYMMEPGDMPTEQRMDPPGASVIPDKRPRATGASAGKKEKEKLRDKKSDRAKVTSPKRVDFHDRLTYKEVNSDGQAGLNDYNGKDTWGIHDNDNTTQTTMTDSRAIRETEIRFLNNDLTNNNLEDDVRWGRGAPSSHDNPNRLTHVSVTVPGTTRTTSSSSRTTSAGANPGPSSNQITHAVSRVNHVTDMNHKWENMSNDSAHSDDGPTTKLRRTVKDIQDPDGLAKIKAAIRKQQEKRTPSANDGKDDEVYSVGGIPGEMNNHDHSPPRHLIHNDYDPLQPSRNDLPPPLGAEGHCKVRKVAAGPPTPTYKGFSETEVKYKYSDYRPPKVMDWRKREKKKKAELKLQQKKAELMYNEIQNEVESKPRKKMTRVVAGGVKKPDKQPKKDIITTSSWRAGQELILRELGPVKGVRRSSQTSDHMSDKNSLPHDREDEDDDYMVGDDDREHRTATSVELERAKALSEEARKVLTDLQLGGSEDDGEGRGKENDAARRRKPAVKRKAPKPSGKFI
ncbi:hypothetical protein FSP39_024216 [Pinctada imbricata]|uniref:Uncharacterized protein n=1 Tax=Pinctada imbricata TaxID=66713 RepID=A0AA88XNT2_PINIB|nr:hypothetical protein FSP39_024216 [Pinctada imbricata]